MIIKRILKDWGLEALIFCFFTVVIIPYGAGITFDSVSFFQAGDHFWSSGKYVHYAPDGGLEFAAHRFPLYPLIVSLFKNFDPDLITFQIILFAALIAGFRNLLKDLKTAKYFLLLLATFPVFMNFFAIWTESLYAVLFVWLMVRLNNEKEYQKSFWIIAIVVLLCLTRMVGIVVAGSLLIAYIIDKRPLRGLMFFIVGAAVIAVWTILGVYYLGETARSIGFIGFKWPDLIFLAAELGRWITPVFGYSFIPLIVGFALFLTPFFFGLKAWNNRREAGVLFWFLIIHFYAYIFFIIWCKMFLDASIAFDMRTLFPVVINFTGILILIQGSLVFDQRSRDKIRFIFPKLIIVVVFLNAFSSWHLRENGIGYNSKDWSGFAFVAELKKINSERIYTNDQAAIYLFADKVKEPVLLPEKMDLYTRKENQAYDAEMDLLEEDIYQHHPDALIVWIRNGITGNVYPDYEELKKDGRYKVVYDDWLCLILQKR